MPIQKNNGEQNSNRRPMSVPNMHFAVSKDNKRVLEILEDNRETKKQIKWWCKQDE